MKQLVIFICIISVLMGCTQNSRTVSSGKGTIVSLSYAKGFSIAKVDAYTSVTVFNPWKAGEVYARYYLVKDSSICVPSDGQKVAIPLQTMVVNSATQLEFLQMLGEIPCITGICNPEYIYNPDVLNGVRSGRIQNMGDAFNLDIERLLLLRPQAVMTTAYNVEDENSKRMKQTGLTLIYNIEWQERTLLARAEWIKFVGAFFDKEAEADSLFQLVEGNYNRLKKLTENCKDRPSVMIGQDYRGTWTMPAGNSFNAQLFRDAAVDYHFAGDGRDGSRSSSIEEALLLFKEADVWVGVQANSLKELVETNNKYRLFKAYRTGNVYSYNKRRNETGGNDYWESGVAHPDRLLADMIRIMHPELLPDYETYYIQQLQ